MINRINLQITVPGQTKYLSLIGKIGENLAKEICLSAKDRETLALNLNTVLTEAMVNTIKHGNMNTSDSDVRICITVSDNQLLIKVYDTGKGFDLNLIPKFTLNSDLLEESGRGIFIIKTLMDSTVYKKSDEGNVLEMRKKL